MEPLGTQDVVLNCFVVVVMPLLIVANLQNWGLRSPLNEYLWREHPTLMRLSLFIIGLLTLSAAVQLAGHFGLMSASAVDFALPLIAIPFLMAAVVEIWLGIGAVVRYRRMRRSQA